MLKGITAAFVVIILGISVLVWAEATFSPTFGTCISEQISGGASQSAELTSGYSTTDTKIGAYSLCTVQVLDRHPGFFTALVSLIIATLVAVFSVTVYSLLRAVRNQAQAIERTIKETERSATAITKVARSVESNLKLFEETIEENKTVVQRQRSISEMQVRGYVTAALGTALPQDRTHDTRFQASALLTNNGPTPAINVVHRTGAAILPVPLPKGFVLPMAFEAVTEGMIPPHQTRTVGCQVADFCDEAEIEEIKRGTGKGLYIWGNITYEDIFKQPHETSFCHLLTWLPDGRLWGYYIPNRNRMS